MTVGTRANDPLARHRPDRSDIVSAEFFDHSADGVFVVDRDWVYVFVNAAGAESVGLAAGEIIGRDMWTVFPASVGSQFERECRRAMRDREPVVLEQYFASSDQWNAIRIFPCDDGLSVYYRDVTHERRSERAARRLAVIVEASNDAVVSQTLDGIVLTWNAAAENMYGYGADEMVGEQVVMLADPDHVDEERALMARVNAGERIEHRNTRRVRKNGTIVEVSLAVFPVCDDDGVVIGSASIARDVTERVAATNAAAAQVQAALDLVEARVETGQALADLARLTLESADIESFGRTACGMVARILAVDFCSILLPTEGSLRVVSEWGWDRRLLATVDNAPAADSQAEYTLRHGTTVIVDDWLTETRFGSSPLLIAHDVHSGLSVAVRYDGSTLGVIGVQSHAPRQFDDTAVRFLESVAQLVGVALEQDRVRRRLVQSERTLQSIVDNAPVAIHVIDAEGRFLIVNRELERIIGMPRDLLLGKYPAEIARLAAGTPGAALVDQRGAASQPTTVPVEHTTHEPDGDHSYLSVSFRLLDADGCPYGLGGISTEVTELVRARAETTSAWLESMDRLARAVEFRDDDTGAHIERMAAYSVLIAELLGFPAERSARIHAAAPMHDIGKLAIPDRVLLKPGPLDAEERKTMDTHADVGFQLLTGSGSSVLELAAVIAQSHHERFDGSGYPRGLVGNAIPIEGRIVAIADSFDALTSDRVYRDALTIEAAVAVMRSETGHFDPEILDLFVSRLDLAHALWSSYHPVVSTPPAATIRA